MTVSRRSPGLDTTMPRGLIGKLAGIPYCSEAQIAAARRSHAGAAERPPRAVRRPRKSARSPSAPAGQARLRQRTCLSRRPLQRRPISLAILTPALAGPFDLGTVVVRTALYIDPETTASPRRLRPAADDRRGFRSTSAARPAAGSPALHPQSDLLRNAGDRRQAASPAGSGAPVSTASRSAAAALPFKPKLAVSFSGRRPGAVATRLPPC